LLNLFKTGCHNLFEFTFQDGDKNISRQKRVKVLPNHYLPSQLLEKASKPVPDGSYKARQGIHANVMNVLMGNPTRNDAWEAINNVKKNVLMYRLEKWYIKKLPYWIYKYNKLNPGYDFRPELESFKLEENYSFHYR
jgi:hypothetical protein